MPCVELTKLLQPFQQFQLLSLVRSFAAEKQTLNIKRCYCCI
jgi:hypothetical protein